MQANVVICGAGIAGVSVAHELAVRHGLRDVVLVDELAPLTMTSEKSNECYRNWWPGPGDAMVRLMNRSIDIMESLALESENVFHLNRRGYLYVTADPERVAVFERAGEEAARLGAGPLRRHAGAAGGPDYLPANPAGFAGQPDGADLIVDPGLIRRHFPYLSPDTAAVLHARRCGWLSAQQLGMFLLDQARESGARFLRARVTGVEVRGGRVSGVEVRNEEGSRKIATDVFVSAAGPYTGKVGRMLGVELPLFSELHAKVAFRDDLAAVPRHAPLLIWTDPQRLPWSEEERELMKESPDAAWLLGELPSGAHVRPEGGGESRMLLLLWAYDSRPMEPVWPPEFDPRYPEITIRGLCRMLPGLRAYLERLPRCLVDGGYYTKTRENRPLLGPLPVEGAFLAGALSGFGIMAGCGAGELLATYITGGELPDYASWFRPDRYEDPEYRRLLADWDQTGQL